MMNIKVLLVDDEKLERVLIHKGYLWEENGFEIIGEASDGEEALEIINITTPDIVITDINMPYMDGLKLTEEIRKRNIPCKIVIVTGYRDFDYARRALKLGVKDFLLKPINIGELKKVVESIKEELLEEYSRNQEFTDLKEKSDENQDIIKQSFLQLLVANRIDEEEGYFKLKMFNLTSLLNGCVCINVKISGQKENDNEKYLDYFTCIAEELNKSDDKIGFIYYLSNLIIFYNCNDVFTALEYAKILKVRINREINMDITIGISNKQFNFSGIAEAYRQSEKAISANVIFDPNSIISYEDYCEIKKINNTNIEIDWKDFIFSVENCIEEKVTNHINEYTNKIKDARIMDNGYLKLMTMNMLSKASMVLIKHRTSLEQVIGEESLYKEVSNIETVNEMNLCIHKMIKKILLFSDHLRNKSRNNIVDKATDYIEQNLFSPSLSLKTVATEIFVNESYLSRVFKQEVGKSLIEYITGKRIKHSILLFNTTDLKAYEIAEKVGICDPHYFSICFKKYVGVTVTEYKKPIT